MSSDSNAKLLVKSLFNVESWVCVVTGGGTGIGLMIAQAFANNGAKVYIRLFRWNFSKTKLVGRMYTLYRTNVIGYFFVTTAFLPKLLATASSRSQHTGSVINISSMSGITHNSWHHFKYNVSKVVTIHLSTLLVQEFRRKAVQVRLTMVLVGGSDEQIPVGEDYRKRRESLQVVLGVKKICPSCIAAGLQPIRVWTYPHHRRRLSP